MKGIVCKEFGPPSSLKLEEIPSLKPKEKEVLVSVKACGINFPDTLIIQGLYQFKPELPFTPGSDIAGVVKEVGEGVKHVKPGDQVFGFVLNGGLAEEVIVPANACFPKPPGMNFPVAASFMMAYGTSFHALKDRAQLKEGETLLVLGASGGVGLAAVELGKLMGAKVIAAASSDEKLKLCKEYGADEIINYKTDHLKGRIKELTNGEGVDVVYDPVGGDYSEAALRGTAWNGRFLVVGFAAGDIPKIPLNLPLLKGASVVGVFWGSFAMKNPKDNMENTMTL
ncbi:MAG: NADPH:quinone oxidoreductase family protein, partial [Bacteroidota bacterium]